MSLLSVNGTSVSDKKLGAEATLNPNAAEFVPIALRPRVASISIPDTSSKFAASAAPTPGKSVLNRSESSVSTNSEDETQQFWHHQLPDDITPDFKATGVDETRDINSLCFSNLSLTDVNESSRYTSSNGSGFMLKGRQGLSLEPLHGTTFAEKLKYPISSYREYQSLTRLQPSFAKPWEKRIVSNNQLFARELHPYSGVSSQRSLADLPNDQLLDNADVSPLEFLASQFPGFAAEDLAEVYLSSGGDLNLTIEMLSQLEVDGVFDQTFYSRAMPTPNPSAFDFPTHDGLAKPAGDYHQNLSPYASAVKDSTHLFRSSSIPSRGGSNFASAVRRVASQDSSIWKYERNGSSDDSIGSSQSPQVLASSYNTGRVKGVYGDRLLNQGSAHAYPLWRETGKAVANEYSELREEAHDHARLRTAYFEQARKAYLIGNKSLARESSIKGQLHTKLMKSAHGKAQESIYQQRSPDMQAIGRERIIDLNGLQVNEAIHVLKQELAVLRIAARSTDQRMIVYIRIGTDQHARGSRSPARLPTAVQRYLLEDEGLDYSELQPGLLRVVIY